MEEVWESDILPLLEEHHAGEGLDVAQHYSLLDILAEVGAAEEPENSDELPAGTTAEAPESASTGDLG